MCACLVSNTRTKHGNMAVTGCLAVIVVVFVACISINRCTIVSQSSVEQCEAGDSKESVTPDGRLCEKKVLVSIVLGGGQVSTVQNVIVLHCLSHQGETDSLYANIDQVYEKGESELSRLERPFRIEISKSNILASYRLHYLGVSWITSDCELQYTVTDSQC